VDFNARVKKAPQSGCVEGGGHDDYAKVRPRTLLQLQCKPQQNVTEQMPFVELVEDYGRNAGYRRIALHLLEQDPVRLIDNPRGGRGPMVEADTVADLAANLHTAFGGHAPGKHARSQAAGLETDDPAGGNPVVDKKRWYARGLSRSGGGGYDQAHG